MSAILPGDFTLDKYESFCHALGDLDCPILTVRDFLLSGQPQESTVILRHDVDRRVGAALRMAELEARFDITATYYLRSNPSVFKPEIIRRLHQLKHEVGYHYETLAKENGNKENAIRRFARELERFREIVPVATISMHGSPLSPWNNLDLWRENSFEEFDLIGDVSLSINYAHIYYFTDTGRSWQGNRFNLRDQVNSLQPERRVATTDDLIDFLQDSPTQPVFVNAHPNRWSAGWFEWCGSAVSDWVINRAKWLVFMVRSRDTQ